MCLVMAAQVLRFFFSLSLVRPAETDARPSLHFPLACCFPTSGMRACSTPPTLLSARSFARPRHRPRSPPLAGRRCACVFCLLCTRSAFRKVPDCLFGGAVSVLYCILCGMRGWLFFLFFPNWHWFVFGMSFFLLYLTVYIPCHDSIHIRRKAY